MSYETTLEAFTDESAYGESPFAESYDAPAQSEWGSPFGAAEAVTTLEYGQEFGQEYGQEQEQAQEYGQESYAYNSEWESPFASEQYADAQESEVMWAPNEFPAACGDVTYDGTKWPYGKTPDPDNPGIASAIAIVPHAEVYEFQLSKFDIDRHELKREHKRVIGEFAKLILAGMRSKRFNGEPIRVYTYGEASSTAPASHNSPLSRNRAFNALHAIRCEFNKVGITCPVQYGLYGTGEQKARKHGPDQKEDAQFRGVLVRAFVPIKECEKCKPGPRPATGTAAICVSVPKILPRIATRRPADLIPLGSIVPGLRLPIAIVTKAQAVVRIDERRSRQSRQYTFSGWGLEVALPQGRSHIDLKAELHASLEALVQASAHLGARLQLGPLKLSLRIDFSAFAQLIVKLCAQLRLRLETDLGKPNLPDLRACRVLDARNAGTSAFPFAALQGPAVLVVPGGGYGPAVLTLTGPSVPSLGLASNVIPVPADKSTVRTLLALGGNLQLAQGQAREAESEEEWPESFGDVEAELEPFM
jgi:hypothetical protein